MRTMLAPRRRPERLPRRILPMLAVLALALASACAGAQVRGANIPVGSGAPPAADARAVEVLGAVRTPGRYPVAAAMTVDDVLALAGSPTARAHANRVALLHADGTGSVVSRRTRIGDIGLRGGDQLFIPERTSLTRNAYVLMGTLTAVLCLATILSH